MTVHLILKALGGSRSERVSISTGEPSPFIPFVGRGNMWDM